MSVKAAVGRRREAPHRARGSSARARPHPRYGLRAVLPAWHPRGRRRRDRERGRHQQDELLPELPVQGRSRRRIPRRSGRRILEMVGRSHRAARRQSAPADRGADGIGRRSAASQDEGSERLQDQPRLRARQRLRRDSGRQPAARRHRAQVQDRNPAPPAQAGARDGREGARCARRCADAADRRQLLHAADVSGEYGAGDGDYESGACADRRARRHNDFRLSRCRGRGRPQRG